MSEIIPFPKSCGECSHCEDNIHAPFPVGTCDLLDRNVDPKDIHENCPLERQKCFMCLGGGGCFAGKVYKPSYKRCQHCDGTGWIVKYKV